MTQFFTSCRWRLGFLCWALMLLRPELHAQCNPDVTPPVANCNTLLYVALDSTGNFTLEGFHFDESSSDNCCLSGFTLRRVVDGPCDGDALPDVFAPTLTVCCADIGTPFTAEMSVIDCAGNHSECTTLVTVEDKTPPKCPSNITVSCQNFDPTLQSYGPTDNCCLDTVITLSVDYSAYDSVIHSGTIIHTFTAVDCSANSSNCTHTITVSPDFNPPVAVCNDLVFVSIAPNDDPNDCYGPAGFNNIPPALDANHFAGVTWVGTDAFDAGSFDDCNQVHLTVRRMAPFSNEILGLNSTRGTIPCDNVFPTFPSEFERAITESDSIKFYCSETGSTQTVILRAYQVDAAGHFMLNGFGNPIYNECLVSVKVEDKIPPTVQAPPNLTVTCQNFDPSFHAYGLPTALDNCCLDTIVQTVNYSQFDSICSSGTIVRTFQAFDCSGNSSTLGIQTIVFTHDQNYFIRFPDDRFVTMEQILGVPQFGEPVAGNLDCELIGLSYVDEIFLNDPTADLRLERTWTVINWCTYNPNEPVVQVPNPNPNPVPNHPANLPGVVVAPSGTPAPWAPTVVKINPNDPDPTDYSTFWAANANAYVYKQIIKVIDTFFVAVQGKVFADSSANCNYETDENLLEGWTVRVTGSVTGNVVDAVTDANGLYFAALSGFDTTLVVTLVASGNFGQNCQSEYTVNLAVGDTALQDFPVHLENKFNLLSIGAATARLRRCNNNNQYTLQACNLSSETVQDAYVDVKLDEYFMYNFSSIPGTLVSGNTYRFQLGDLEAGECNSFTINFGISCDAQLGATHCLEAHIFPYEEVANPAWSGANVAVSATCDVDSVRFAITNVGTGDMSQSLDFVVVEDVVMRQEGSFQLGQGESAHYSYSANGSTWRLEAEQEPYHPWGGPEAVVLEGCGGINNAGLVNVFPLNDPNPFKTLDCTENIGSFDPNDKQGFPEGYGNEHFINANTDIEYMIRFQNTGTDTAFKVVILDTLSAQLDPASVRVEVASHTMNFTLLDGNVLRFSFDNILLPDSNINWAASNGFVKFRVSQVPDLADGNRIENQAAIYFDGNDPVLTNTTYHTIGSHFITVSTDDPENGGLVRAYPNPASDAVIFELKDWAAEGRFELANNLGQQIAIEKFAGKQFRFERKNLPAGIYLFKILTNDTKTASGKIILK